MGYAQARKGITLRRLNSNDAKEEVWKEMLIADRTATPADLAASRIDFPKWLTTLRRRDRKIALTPATGETTKEVARRFCISPSRVSQVRRELEEVNSVPLRRFLIAMSRLSCVMHGSGSVRCCGARSNRRASCF
jgi:hypothetical protein